MTNKSYATFLSNCVIVDRAKLQRLPTDQFTDALKDLYDGDLYVKIVDSATKFFSKENLKRLLDEPTEDSRDLSLILEQRGVVMSQEDLDIVKKFKALRDDLLTTASGAYPFAQVPDGWTVETKIKLSKASIRRSSGSDRYTIGYKALKQIWDKAAPWWVETAEDAGGRGVTVSNLRAGGYTRDAEVKASHVQVGCQRIERYEIEQVASHLGWDFPSS